MYFANVANSAYNLYTRNSKMFSQDLHSVMIAISTVHAMIIDTADMVAFLNELWEENTADINEYFQGYTRVAIAIIEGVIGFLTADRTTVKQLSAEVLEEIDEDRQECQAQAQITAKMVQAFVQAFITVTETVTETVQTTVTESLETLKLRAKELGIKGYNFYKDPVKLANKIAEATVI